MENTEKEAKKPEKVESNLAITMSEVDISKMKLKNEKAPPPPENMILQQLFESTVMFFKILNKTLIRLNYNRQRRKQVFESIIKRSTVNEKEIVRGLLEEVKPILEAASKKLSDKPEEKK